MLKGKGILSEFQRAFLHAFATLPDQEHFYLTGGTALAEYYLGHRLSYDLDLFTSDAKLLTPFSRQIELAAGQMGWQITVVRRFASFVEFQVSHAGATLKVDLALDSPFRFAPVALSETGVLVNTFQDIQTDKLLAFFGRTEPRDAIDLYFLLQKTSYAELTDLAKQKDPGFDLYWFAVALNHALSFPDEPARWPVKMLVAWDPLEIKRTFQTLSLQIMQDITK